MYAFHYQSFVIFKLGLLAFFPEINAYFVIKLLIVRHCHCIKRFQV